MASRGYNRYSQLRSGNDTELELCSIGDSDTPIISLTSPESSEFVEITNGSIINFSVYYRQRWVLNYSAITAITSTEKIINALRGPDGLPTTLDQASYEHIVNPLNDGSPRNLPRLFVLESHGNIASICDGEPPIVTIVPMETKLENCLGKVTVRPLITGIPQSITDAIIDNYLGRPYAKEIVEQLIWTIQYRNSPKAYRRIACVFRSDFVTMVFTRYGILPPDTNIVDTDPEWYDSLSELDKVSDYTTNERTLKQPPVKRYTVGCARKCDVA
ncbi:MAG: hypothetical protein LBD43_03350 [Holosporales bacterium]|jgi:hypothetical protein|nr:hypothetical protein [Holosporales bacterium]